MTAIIIKSNQWEKVNVNRIFYPTYNMKKGQLCNKLYAR